MARARASDDPPAAAGPLSARFAPGDLPRPRSGAIGPNPIKPMSSYRYVNFSWDDAKAAALDPVGRLVYRSNLLGGDQRITNTGGGNTSAKIRERDPLTGQPVEVLWVKGSGGDLRTSTRENFSSLYQDKLLALQPLYAARPDKGLKAPAEDDMVGMYAHSTFNLNPRASSIDTPLHSFLPGRHVDHMHPNAVIAIAASEHCEALTKEIFGGEMAYVPWMRPGFELGLAMQEIAAAPAAGAGDHDGAARLHLLGRRRPGMLPPDPGPDRKGRGLHRGEVCGQGRRCRGLRRPEIPDAGPRGAPGGAGRDPALAARARLPGEALHRHGAGRREDPALRELPGRRPPGRARHLVPRPFPAHQDQAAVRRLEPADGGRRRPEEKADGRPRAVPQGLRRLLREVPARELAARCATPIPRSC